MSPLANSRIMDPSLSSAAWAKLPPQYAIPAQPPSLAEAQAYCERLARTHYENFSVATWFLPKRLREHFYSVYAYCRISDDLGDEVGDPQQALALLDDWEAELDATYASLPSHADDNALSSRAKREGAQATAPSHADDNALSSRAKREGAQATERESRDPYTNAAASPRHPVFIALRETIRAFDIPQHEFSDLLRAFRQDQTVQRYETFDDLLGYCRYSANPVGHLVLYVCGYRDTERQLLSDHTCTALQLANFWQDVTLDYDKGRIYLPLEDLRRFGVSEQEIAERRPTPPFLRLMRFEIERAREWFGSGLPLASRVDRELALDIELFTRGGQEILNAIERQGYDVLRRRPVISKPRKLWLVAQAALRKLAGSP